MCIFSNRQCPFSEILSIRFELSTLTVVFSYFPFSLEMTLPSYASVILNQPTNHSISYICCMSLIESDGHAFTLILFPRLSISNCYSVFELWHKPAVSILFLYLYHSFSFTSFQPENFIEIYWSKRNYNHKIPVVI